MQWERWSRTDEKGLARYVTSEATQLLPLKVNRLDIGDNRRQLIQALYDALLGKQIRYALEEYDPSEYYQLIRTPTKILEAPRQGTCLDLAILFCGLCLGNELLPILIMLKGHALAAVSLKDGLRNWDAIDRNEKFSFKTGTLNDANRLRPLLDSGQYLAVECTGFAQSEKLSQTPTTSPAPPECGHRQDGVLSFERAVAAGREQLDFELRPFEFALDIAILHNRWGIKPVPAATHTTNIPVYRGGIGAYKIDATIYQYNNTPSDEEKPPADEEKPPEQAYE